VEEGVPRYTAATFYHRLDVLSMYEKWGDVPADARDAVIEWDLQEFIEKWQPAIQEMMAKPGAAVRIPNRDVLQLEEALATVEAAEKFAVLPCDCRTITMACQRPVETCIRLNEAAAAADARGLGRQLTKQECLQLVIDLDREGLMHTGDRDWRTNDMIYGFCNCCACDCFPIRAGIRLGLERQWPLAHHAAARDEDTCVQCGTCAERCHFGAFYLDDYGLIAFDPAKCWGCGICATGCPEGAIEMIPLTVVPGEE
jgi:Pyruvate/2-oxoacid:ferredoxin oxidoreductase delta subunit